MRGLGRGIVAALLAAGIVASPGALRAQEGPEPGRGHPAGEWPLVGGNWSGCGLFFVGGPISLSGGGEAGGNWIRQGLVRSGGGSGGRRYFCRQRPMGDFRWSSRAS